MINLDKLLHFGVGLLLAVAVSFFSDHRIAILSVLLIALLKEFYDFKHPTTHTCDGMDVIATVVGGLVGVVLI